MAGMPIAGVSALAVATSPVATEIMSPKAEPQSDTRNSSRAKCSQLMKSLWSPTMKYPVAAKSAVYSAWKGISTKALATRYSSELYEPSETSLRNTARSETAIMIEL
eukprot:Amastigsp_a879_177.p7 type:complete len:107 gc:universal Amastigsp_a879_177:1034-1354(+)